MEKGTELVFAVLGRPISIPAANRWTKLAPAFSRVLLMRAWCDVLPEAFAAVAGVEEPEGEPRGADGPLSMEAFREMEAGRARRAAIFLQSKDSLERLLIWHAVCGPLMRVHYRLFTEGTWYSHLASTSIVDFLSPQTSPAMEALQELGSMACGAGMDCGFLSAITARYGQVSEWSSDVLATFESAWMPAVCSLWRRLVHPWDAYPWKLWLAVDPSSEERVRLAAASEFLQAPRCCLDSGCAAKLRGLVRQPEDLACIPGSGQTDLQLFLTTLFTRAVATSTYIERDFAKFSAWTKQAPQGIATIAAKHACEALRSIVEREKRKRNLPKVSRRGRPAWARPRPLGRRLTGLHMFQKQVCRGGSLAASLVAWRALTPADQEAWNALARGRRVVAAVAAENDTVAIPPNAGGGPWGLWDLGGPWPLAHHVLQEHLCQGSFKSLSASWSQDASTRSQFARVLVALLAVLSWVQFLVRGFALPGGCGSILFRGMQGHSSCGALEAGCMHWFVSGRECVWAGHVGGASRGAQGRRSARPGLPGHCRRSGGLQGWYVSVRSEPGCDRC